MLRQIGRFVSTPWRVSLPHNRSLAHFLHIIDIRGLDPLVREAKWLVDRQGTVYGGCGCLDDGQISRPYDLRYAEHSANSAPCRQARCDGRMTEILFALVSTLVACVAVFVSVAFYRVLRAGPRKVSYLRRKRYGLHAWATGALPKTTNGTTVHELEGLELKSRGGRLHFVRQTRATTSEV